MRLIMMGIGLLALCFVVQILFALLVVVSGVRGQVLEKAAKAMNMVTVTVIGIAVCQLLFPDSPIALLFFGAALAVIWTITTISIFSVGALRAVPIALAMTVGTWFLLEFLLSVLPN